MKDLSLHLIDILQNSITAKATRIKVGIHANRDRDILELEVADNGRGMDKDLLKQVDNPFVTTRTTRKVGLGIPLLKASAQLAEGDLTVSSQEMKGTTIKATFKISHIDRLPLGSVSETMTSVVMGNPEIDFELVISNNSEEFRFDTVEVRKRLDGVPINEYEVLTWIKEFIDENVRLILGGVLNEIDC